MTELEKAYDHSKVEDKIYKQWMDSGYFNPENLPEASQREPFTVSLPPPNVTGTLHLGHAFEDTIQDALIRYHRMKGKKTLWVPGTDHAAIATQAKFEKEHYKKESKSRHDYSREEFFQMIQKFALENQNNILSQLHKMGLSLDWSRLAFTLDDQRELAVQTAFTKMYEAGLIYRGYRVVNWDVKGQTTVSDDEIEYEETKGKLYTFKYSKDFPIAIATTRPETKVGDAAVAVHPDDKRYKKYVGQEFKVNFCGSELNIKIVADKEIDPSYGTGAVGVTPLHSMVDFEIAQRHNLTGEQVINEVGKMTVKGALEGKKTSEARELVVKWLNDNDLLEKEEDITQNLSRAQRTGGLIEPLPKLQWFVDVNKKFTLANSKIKGIKPGEEVTLKDIMSQAVKSGQIKILPERFEKTYFHWIENLRDWCISRQIIYGHQIPVWYDQEGGIHLPKTVEIIFARHGQSERNANKLVAGKMDSPLTDLGRKQSEELGKKLKDKGIKKIFASNLSRSNDTAKIIANIIGYPENEIETLEDLNEVDLGKAEKSKVEEPFNPLKESIESGTGESLEQIELRARNVIARLKKETEGPILIIGHNMMNICIQAQMDGKSKVKYIEERGKIGVRENCSMISYFQIKEPGQKNLTQDTDTLDTWFSSGLWTFSTLGWPNETFDLKNYHPTSVMMPGYEILFFWVARMVLMSGFLLGDVPFGQVYLHGIVRDNKGRKFSKSLNNGIDPLEMTAKYGTDALRMALVFGAAPGNDVIFDEQKVKGMKHFANKLWNIARFVLSNGDELQVTGDEAKGQTDADKEILDKLNALVKTSTEHIEAFRLHEAAQEIYQFTWHEFADVYIEKSKEQLKDEKLKKSTLATLNFSLLTVLKLLHPFMPFVTEEIWSKLNQKDLLIITKWPK